MKNKSNHDNIQLSPEFPRSETEPPLLSNITIVGWWKVHDSHGLCRFDLQILPGNYRVRFGLTPETP